MGNLVSKLVGLLLTIVVSAFIYKYFEKPLTNKRPKELIN
jgi:peptidoglycan/LPS O-acetylase OafA/YrhL